LTESKVTYPLVSMLMACLVGATAFAAEPNNAASKTEEASLQLAELNNAGVIAMKAGDYALAVKKFSEAVRLSPGYLFARRNLAAAYNNMAGTITQQPAKAIQFYHRSLYLNPDAFYVVENLNQVIAQLKIDPARFEDRLKLGDEALSAGDFCGAIIEYRQALKIKDAPELRQKIAEIPELQVPSFEKASVKASQAEKPKIDPAPDKQKSETSKPEAARSPDTQTLPESTAKPAEPGSTQTLPESNTGTAESSDKPAGKEITDLSGLWYGLVSTGSAVLESSLDLAMAGNELSGTLTSQGNGGVSVHHFKGKFDPASSQFVCRDTGVSRRSGYGKWSPLAVEEYLFRPAENGSKLLGSCRQEKSKTPLSFTFSRRNMNEKPQPSFRSLPNERELSLSEARQYLVALINKQRAKFALEAVVLDEIASNAGQLHTDETASAGYSDHYDLAGRSPDWRYTLVGGTNMIMENQMGPFGDPRWGYKLSPSQRFNKSELEKIAAGFFDEVPPNDGHRKNILGPAHNRVGIGLSVSAITMTPGFENELVTCCQEFIDAYGTFSALPLSAKAGDVLHFTGKLAAGVKLHALDIRWDNIPKPNSIEQLRKNYYHGYMAPEKSVTTYFAASNLRPGESGSVRFDVPVPSSWKKGLYHFYLWVTDRKGRKVVTSHQLVAVGADKPVAPLAVGNPPPRAN
jgi:uncharacterized protein YkwD/tetratricopeptide (TPR) repeat protein